MTEPVRTVYIGGGTPSLMPPSILRECIHGLRSVFGFDEVSEFTCEANPGTVTAEWLDAAVSSGVNRLSVGMQAGQERLLALLGRIHSVPDVSETVSLCRRAGIGNISLDLMFGIPTQQIEEWEATLQFALSQNPVHISAYGLIPEEGTPLYRDLRNGALCLPEPETEREMYDRAITLLNAHGFIQYEISNFARPGYECRHNIGYWQQIPYIGLGVSAASMTGLTRSQEGMACVRRTNPGSLEDYAEMVDNGPSGAGTEMIGPAESRFETMMLGLRMNCGIREDYFESMHGVSMTSCYGEKLDRLRSAGLLEYDNGSWRLSRRGFDIQNSVLVELMDD